MKTTHEVKKNKNKIRHEIPEEDHNFVKHSGGTVCTRKHFAP